jgi:tyrosinase
MRITSFALALAATVGLVSGDALSDLEAKGRTQIDSWISTKSTTCTKDKLRVRKEWSVISEQLL